MCPRLSTDGIWGRKAARPSPTWSSVITILAVSCLSLSQRSVGQLPDYYYQKPSAKRELLGTTVLPLYAFGWGLSYSTFKYGNLRVIPDAIGPLGQTKVTVDVTIPANAPAMKWRNSISARKSVWLHARSRNCAAFNE